MTVRAYFCSFLNNIINCFGRYNLFWHLLAILLTYIFVTSGFDWLYFESSRGSLLRTILSPAVRLGSRLPIIVPLILFVAGKVSKNLKATYAAFALGQSVLIGLLIAAFYKSFTGRVHPPRLLTPATVDTSREFQFGFLRGGVFWGWPSSHTTIAFAMSVTLLILYPKNKTIMYFAIIYAVYIGFGVSISIHWFSDFVAGAIIGTTIGIVVGGSFRETFAKTQQ
ncbi:MAG: phosphatase PAP2 family protein [Dissulfurispiraceae bacterium]